MLITDSLHSYESDWSTVDFEDSILSGRVVSDPFVPLNVLRPGDFMVSEHDSANALLVAPVQYHPKIVFTHRSECVVVVMGSQLSLHIVCVRPPLPSRRGLREPHYTASCFEGSADAGNE